MHIPVYVIQHTPTGGYIPNVMGQKCRRGGSLLSPVQVDERPATHPRLFPSRGSASNFLTQWARGEHIADEDYDVRVMPVASRKREEMKIVTLFVDVPT